MSNLKATKYHSLTKLSPNVFFEPRKGSGKECEQDSLKVMQSALDRHIKGRNYPKSISRDMTGRKIRAL